MWACYTHVEHSVGQYSEKTSAKQRWTCTGTFGILQALKKENDGASGEPRQCDDQVAYVQNLKALKVGALEVTGRTCGGAGDINSGPGGVGHLKRICKEACRVAVAVQETHLAHM
eukprot:s806_g14.t1